MAERVPVRLFDLISLARSSPHPLLIFALYLMSEEEFFQERLVSEGGLTGIFNGVISSTKIVVERSYLMRL
jgi:hypothetical protein